MSKLPLKALVLVGLCLIVAGCATSGSTLTKQNMTQFNENVDKWFPTLSECTLPVIEQNQPYFEKVLTGPQDPRKVYLLTLKEPISKQFKTATPAIAAQMNLCLSKWQNEAQKFSPDIASAIQTGTQNTDAVFIDMIAGKYKTYGQFNEALFTVYTANLNRLITTSRNINANYLARYQAEVKDENYRTSMALMMFGAGMQNAGTASQNAYNNVRNAAPVTTNCRQIGGTVSCSSY